MTKYRFGPQCDCLTTNATRCQNAACNMIKLGSGKRALICTLHYNRQKKGHLIIAKGRV